MAAAPAGEAEAGGGDGSDSSRAGDETGRDEQDRPTGAPARPAGDSPEIFIPSEEISEDFAVPYPVDI